MKVIVGDSPGKIVLKSIGEVKTIESAGDQRIQVSAPECFVVVPGLIFNLAAEVSAYAAHLICRFLLEDLLQVQSCQGLRAEAHSLGEFNAYTVLRQKRLVLTKAALEALRKNSHAAADAVDDAHRWQSGHEGIVEILF
jgi:hypothetical protein